MRGKDNKNSNVNNICPICIGNYYDINKSYLVCVFHENWFITECSSCKRKCFSDTVGICVRCGTIKFNENRLPPKKVGKFRPLF